MTPQEMQQAAQMRAMALRGQEPQAMQQDADALSAVGGLFAGWGGKSGRAVSEGSMQRGDALRALAQNAIRQQEGFVQQDKMQGAESEQQTKLAGINNSAAMDRLLAELRGKEKEAEAKKAGDLQKVETDLRNKLLDMPETKDALKVAGLNRAVQNASDTGAGDIGLLYNFLHVVEPGSQVKESEFATAGSAGGLRAEVQGYFNKLDGKGQLPPSMRRQLKAESRLLTKSRLAGYSKIQNSFRGLSGAYGVNADNVVIPLGLEEDGPSPGGATGAGGDTVMVLPPAGADGSHGQPVPVHKSKVEEAIRLGGKVVTNGGE